jgi:metallo-beta-lactamase family protein
VAAPIVEAEMADRPPTLQFLGGARTVTGSKFLVTAGRTRVLVDCGVFQGLRALRERNWDVAVPDPSTVAAVVLTHAHVDHCGYLPRLVAEGFRGPVYATPSTSALAGIVLPDCGHLYEEEAEYANRKGFSRHEPALPLYTEEDAWRAVDLLRPIPFGARREVADGVSVRLSRAGHILGSATVELRLDDDGPSIGFSGDLGRPSHPLLAAPDPPPTVGTLLIESTYGNRRHDDDRVAVDRLAGTIAATIGRGGSVLIPAFAVDRTEVILHHLAELARTGRLPGGVPVYVDSPMALSALRVYRDALERGDPDIRPVREQDDPFDVPGLREVPDVEGSKALNRPADPSIIISASGMASGGRVVHHLAHLLPDRRNTVILVGYQAEGTRGRLLVDGAGELKMLGRYVRVRATVVDIPGFSVHADASELLAWVAAARHEPDCLYIVHGEPAAAEALASSLARAIECPAVVPRTGERVRLDRP